MVQSIFGEISLFRLRLWLRDNLVFVLVLLALTYLGYHAQVGARGLQSWSENKRVLAQSEAELESLRAKLDYLRNKVDGLRPDSLDQDLLEEELLKLGYVKRDEFVILTPAAD